MAVYNTNGFTAGIWFLLITGTPTYYKDTNNCTSLRNIQDYCIKKPIENGVIGTILVEFTRITIELSPKFLQIHIL